MTQEVEGAYKCTELELYAIAELGYNNLETDLAVFAVKKAKYTAAFLAALRAVRKAAMDLPDEEAREEGHQTLRNLLVSDYLPPVLDNFNDLKGYIKDAWPNEKPEPRYEAAGGKKYAKAAAKDWESVEGLNASMQQFIAAHSAKLINPGGMTGAFVTKVNDDETNFDDTYKLFMKARETGVARGEKISANNLLHKELMGVLEDGAERVWRANAEKRKNYIFDTLKNIVSPPGSASLKVLVIKGDDTVVANVPVTIKQEGATLATRSAGISVTTNKEGVALFESADPGRYAGVVVVDGVKISFTKEIDTGVNARITVEVPLT
ncbi:MAG: hypothetical protein HY841_14345 [Bacteroidetes bacterium]|nr:hypothetical protein [Bacteroidota bacterium]